MLTENKTTYNYNMMNIVKLICAVLVVMIHTSALMSISEDLWVGTSLSICRVAVPFFFIVSGFFFYRAKPEYGKKAKIKKYTKLYFKFLLLETVILLPGLIFMAPKMPLLILIRSILFTGFTGSLWYISSMVIGMFCIMPLMKRNMYKTLMLLSMVLFLFGLAGDSYFAFFKGTSIEVMTSAYTAIFAAMQIGFTASIPFLTIGVLINKLGLIEKIKNPGRHVILGGILVVIEAMLLFKNKIPNDYNLYFSLLIFAPALFIFAMKSTKKINSKKANYARSLSVLIYVLHQPLMLFIFSFINIQVSSVIKFIIVLAVSTLVSVILIKIKFDKFLGLRA